MDESYNAQIRKWRLGSALPILTFSLAFFILTLISHLAQALPAPEASPAYLTRIFTDVSYFETKANYDVNGGSYVGLSGGRYYRLIEGQVGIEHWLMDDFSVFTQVGIAGAESYDGVFTRHNTSATDLLAGFRYVMMRAPLTLIPEAWLSYPFNKFTSDTDDVMTGEGVMRAFAGLWAEFPIYQIYPFVEVGALYQDDGRAALALYELGANWITPRFKVGGKVYGSSVISNDEYTDERVNRDVVTNRVNGGSWKFYSVDPTVLGLEAHLNFDLNENFRLNGSFDKTINGEASASGWTAKVGVEYLFPSDDVQRTNTVRTPKVLEPVPAEEKAFEPDPTDYDKSLFVEPKPKKKPKKRKPRTKKIDVDKSLDEVQKSLEK